MFGLNDVSQRKGTVLNSFFWSRYVGLSHIRGNSVVLKSTTQGSTTHMPLTLCTHIKSMTFIDSLPIVSSPPSSSASGLLNLSKYELNSGCKSLLAKGLKYIPAPRVTKRIKVEEAYSNFARRLKLSFFFHNKKSRTRDQKFRAKSNFIPAGPIDPVLKLELDHLERSLGSLELKKHRII